MATFLDVQAIRSGYDKQIVVDDISFQLKEGELGCLLGPSGCGKTTILHAISGFRDVSKGQIELDDKLLSKSGFTELPERRNVGMVFQDHSLFPHLTIAENIRFGLYKRNKMEQKSITHTMLELIGLHGYEDKYPHELSGGQNQRVALVRAIAPRPKLLLMDEPFSNLDSDLRESLGYEVRSLLKHQGITAVMVTHDQNDAFALGDSIGVMSKGKLLQWGSSFDLYHEPNSRFVANFIGDGVFVRGTMKTANIADTEFGKIRGATTGDIDDLAGKEVDLLIRPDDVTQDPSGMIQGIVSRKAFKGAQTLYTVRAQSGGVLLSLLPSHDNYAIGDSIRLSIQADHLVCFPAEIGG